MPRKQPPQAERIGPEPKFSLPVGVEGQPLTIIYGHNVEARKVLVQFGAYVSSIIVSPEDARQIAKELCHYADMAEGEKVM